MGCLPSRCEHLHFTFVAKTCIISLFHGKKTRVFHDARYGKPQEIHMDEVRAMDDVADEGEEGEGECEMCTLPSCLDVQG